MIWCCPYCHGDINYANDNAVCRKCQREYPVVTGIADLRIDAPAWIDFDADRNRAFATEDRVKSDGLEAAIRDVFLISRKFDEQKATYRLKQVLSSIEKFGADLDRWLMPAASHEGPILEIGCGPGQLIAAAALRGTRVAGIDVSLEWLVIAKHLIMQSGGKAQLAAAFAERLPVKSNSIGSVISLDVIEHVGDQPAFISEIARALTPGGRFALSTPNRFSLSPEPHVGVWGVGYLPAKLQAPWVRLMSGKSYEFTRLLSVSEAKKLFPKRLGLSMEIIFPAISDAEMRLFSRFKLMLARIYNSIIKLPFIKPFMRFFGAYYRMTGVKVQERKL